MEKNYPSIITTQNGVYLGTVKDNIVTGTTDLDYGKYLVEKANGTLESIVVGDRGTITVKPPTEELTFEYDRIQSLWDLAVKRSANWATIQCFTQLVGGKK